MHGHIAFADGIYMYIHKSYMYVIMGHGSYVILLHGIQVSSVWREGLGETGHLLSSDHSSWWAHQEDTHCSWMCMS